MAIIQSQKKPQEIHFNKLWVDLNHYPLYYNWLVEVNGNEYEAGCKVCRTTIYCSCEYGKGGSRQLHVDQKASGVIECLINSAVKLFHLCEK